MDWKDKIKNFLGDPSRENFEAMRSDDLCLSLAFALIGDKDLFTQYVQTCEQWASIYCKTYGPLRDYAWEFLSSQQMSLNGWRCFYVQNDGKLRSLAIGKMAQMWYNE